MKFSKIFMVFSLLVSGAFGVEQASLFDVTDANNQNTAANTQNIQNAQNTQNLSQNTTAIQAEQEVFGQNLFSGNFTMVSQHIYNPDYILAIGDVVNVKLWGAYEFEQSLIIDSQGNIFLPQVGTIRLLGVKNSNLVAVITKSVKQVFKDNVQVYADMGVYQNVSVFVAGNVNKPGLYKGLSSDSLIQFIDKAAGINPAYGSFRKITILRNNKPYRHVDLYDFMVNGKIEMFALKNGDVILVDSVGAYVSANGEVLRPYRFEAKNATMSLAELAKLAGTKPMVTSAVVRSHTVDSKIVMRSYPLSAFGTTQLGAGDMVEFITDHAAAILRINIEGEQNGAPVLIVPKGTTLGELISQIKFNPQSNQEAIQLYRKSTAQMQKKLIDSHLRELESIALTTSSSTNEEAAIRAKESEAILRFIERARQVEPKGQVVISEEGNINEVVLQEEDKIFIPTKDNIVLVQGEVALPGAFTHVPKAKMSKYLEMAGDLNQRADKSRVIVISANGKAEKYKASSSATINQGDSILVLPKVETKTLQATSVITQILYQLAVAAKVVLDIK